MGVFGFFSRHKEEYVEEPHDDIDSSGAADSDFKPAFREPLDFPPVSPQINSSSTDMQLVLARLELINQRLEVMDRRLQVIEAIAKENK